MDYVWYIVIGVFVLFTIIGFVADKTGLAKKTFSKSVHEVKPKNKTVGQEEVLSLNDDGVSSGWIDSNMDEPIEEPVESLEPVEQDNLMDAPVLSEENVIEPVIEDNSTMEMNDSVENEEIASSADEWAIEEANSNDTSDLYIAEESDVESNLDSVNLENDSLQTENIEMSEMEPTSEVNTTVEEETPVVEENIQVDEIPEGDMSLPDLDDLNISEDEDVWKF